MELLSHPKTEYLLDASLSSLHAESQEWLNEIDFWGDEMTFFYKLLTKRKAETYFPGEELAALEMELIRIKSEKIDKIKGNIVRHELSLAEVLMTTFPQNEQHYRELHRQLLMEVSNIHMMIRNFKKEVFSFVLKYD